MFNSRNKVINYEQKTLILALAFKKTRIFKLFIYNYIANNNFFYSFIKFSDKLKKSLLAYIYFIENFKKVLTIAKIPIFLYNYYYIIFIYCIYIINNNNDYKR